MPVLPCFGSVCLIETPGKLLWIAQFWSSFCTAKKLQRNRFLMNVYIFAPATVTWRFPGPFAHCFCTMLLAGISDIIQYLSLLHVFFNISSFQRSAYFPVWPTLLPLLLAGLYHIWRAARTSKHGFLEILSWHVCSGIGHRLPIIDSFPSLLGALHIGPIPWLVALLVAGRRTSQFVFVSSLHLLKHPKIQRFRGSLSQRSDIKDLAWVDLAVLAFLACQEGK